MRGFRLNGHRVLEIDLQGGSVRAATGSMIAYTGEVTFRNAGLGGGDGLRAAIKRRATGESVALMQCSGTGTVWFAKDAMDVVIVELDGDTLKVESEQLLAISDGLRTDVAFAGLRGASSGQGLFTTTVTGAGAVALLSAGGPLIALEVSPQFPLVVDPDAFVASSGRLDQTFVTDVSWRNLIGESSGEAFSLRFDGTGVVYVQPEER
ncbi:AIM24 family protein [Pseudonocardia sp. DSM 110487]|uniref:AIM24 family protein n=1 Tax=Pseudonocardia sp. DSM 110487 TaxID=2865833 RepID=UPI001C6A5A9E|nr:AIM24 family protein [Pseudonocardia sp. DSM 110487]QYN32055.1 AIM24 family protein [Pseudonocardia sp. DSM 110487]